MTRVRSTEEPCAAKVARTVLETRRGSDPLAEFNPALRCVVLWRQLMQGPDNAKGDGWVERLLSRRETGRLRGRPTFPVLVETVTCAFNGRHPDASWI